MTHLSRLYKLLLLHLRLLWRECALLRQKALLDKELVVEGGRVVQHARLIMLLADFVGLQVYIVVGNVIRVVLQC